MAQNPKRSSNAKTPKSSLADQLYPAGKAIGETTLNDSQNDPNNDQAQAIGGQENDAGNNIGAVTPFAKMANSLYQPDDKPAPGEDVSNSGPSAQSGFDRSFLDKSGKNCYKPPNPLESLTKMVREGKTENEMGPLAYAKKFDIAGAKGIYSLLQDLFTGEKDIEKFIPDIAGRNGEKAKQKARSQLSTLVHDSSVTGEEIYKGMKKYCADPNFRNAVNFAFEHAAPILWKHIKERGWQFAQNPDKSGRFAGRTIFSLGIARLPGMMDAGKTFLKTLARIGKLDATDKKLKTRINGYILDMESANRNSTPAGK